MHTSNHKKRHLVVLIAVAAIGPAGCVDGEVEHEDAQGCDAEAGGKCDGVGGHDALGSLLVELPDPAATASGCERVRYHPEGGPEARAIEFGVPTPVPVGGGCLRQGSAELCDLEIVKGEVTSISVSTLRVDWNPAAFEVDAGLRPQLDVLAVSPGEVVDPNVVVKPLCSFGLEKEPDAGPIHVFLPGEYDLEFRFEDEIGNVWPSALDEDRQTVVVAGGEAGTIDMTPRTERRASVEFRPFEGAQLQAPELFTDCQFCDPIPLIVDEHKLIYGNIALDVVEFESPVEIELGRPAPYRFFPTEAEDKFAYVVNNIPYPLDLRGGDSEVVQVEHLDAHDIAVLDPGTGETTDVEAEVIIEVVSADGTKKRHTFADELGGQSHTHLRTPAGIDLPPLEYEVKMSYQTRSGSEQKTYACDFREPGTDRCQEQ